MRHYYPIDVSARAHRYARREGAIRPIALRDDSDRYDVITRVLSYGQDGRWKRRLVEMAAPADRQPVGALLEADRHVTVCVDASDRPHMAGGTAERGEAS